MALTRRMLKGMGITEEQIDTIIEAHTDTVDALKAERDNYKTEAEKVTQLEADLAEAQKEKGFKAKYEQEHSNFEAYKQNQAETEAKAKKESAYKKLLQKVGVSEKRIDSVLKVTDVSKLELDDDGNIKTAEELEKTIKTEWADFIVTDGTKGADVTNPPAEGGDDGKGTPSRAAMVAKRYYTNVYGEIKGENK